MTQQTTIILSVSLYPGNPQQEDAFTALLGATNTRHADTNHANHSIVAGQNLRENRVEYAQTKPYVEAVFQLFDAFKAQGLYDADKPVIAPDRFAAQQQACVTHITTERIQNMNRMCLNIPFMATPEQAPSIAEALVKGMNQFVPSRDARIELFDRQKDFHYATAYARA